MAKILSICADDRLRYTREALLCRTGAEVVSSCVDSGFNLIRQHRFDLLVMGYSVPVDVATQFCELFRHLWPESKILYVSFPLHPERSSIVADRIADRIIDWTEGPDVFQGTAQELLLLVEQQTDLHPKQKPRVFSTTRRLQNSG